MSRLTSWLAVLSLIFVWGTALRVGLKARNRRVGRFLIACALVVFLTLAWSVYRAIRSL